MLRGHSQAPASAEAASRLIRLFTFIILLAFVPILVVAQSGTDSTGTGGKHVIQGRIYYPSGQRVDTRTLVRLEGTNTGGLSVMCDTNGYFSFSSLSPGPYFVVIDGGEYYESVRESVYIDQDLQGPPGVRIPSYTRPYTVNIDLRPKRTVVSASGNGVIDATLAAVPEAARTLYQQGMESARNNKHDVAIEKFLAAIAQFPEFPQALNALGYQYIVLNQADKAVRVLRSAVRLAPNVYSHHLNLGSALYKNNQPAEAEAEIKEALKISGGDWQAHLWLGLIQIKLRRFSEAEKELRRSLELGGNDLYLPHYYLGGIYWQAGDHKRAADELEQYLRLNPKAEDAERIRRSIAELRGRTS
jgi:Tfp pilus assembly protein PilF